MPRLYNKQICCHARMILLIPHSFFNILLYRRKEPWQKRKLVVSFFVCFYKFGLRMQGVNGSDDLVCYLFSNNKVKTLKMLL